MKIIYFICMFFTITNIYSSFRHKTDISLRGVGSGIVDSGITTLLDGSLVQRREHIGTRISPVRVRTVVQLPAETPAVRTPLRQKSESTIEEEFNKLLCNFERLKNSQEDCARKDELRSMQERLEAQIEKLRIYSLESRRLICTSTHSALCTQDHANQFTQDRANQLLKKFDNLFAWQIYLEEKTTKQIADLTVQVDSLANQLDTVNQTIQGLLVRLSMVETFLGLKSDPTLKPDDDDSSSHS